MGGLVINYVLYVYLLNTVLVYVMIMSYYVIYMHSICTCINLLTRYICMIMVFFVIVVTVPRTNKR